MEPHGVVSRPTYSVDAKNQTRRERPVCLCSVRALLFRRKAEPRYPPRTSATGSNGNRRTHGDVGCSKQRGGVGAKSVDNVLTWSGQCLRGGTEHFEQHGTLYRMANFHTGSSTEPLVDADVVNGTQIKTVEYQCHVLGGVELPWAEHGERVISRCSKQFVYGVILRNPQSVQEVRLNHHNPSITEPSVLPPCARWAVGNRRLSKNDPIITNTVPTSSEGMKVADRAANSQSCESIRLARA